MTPDKTSRRLSSRGTLPSTSPFSRHKQVGSKVELTVGALEAAVERSRKLCASLRMSLFSSEIGGSSDSDKQLSSKSSLENLSLVAEQLQNMEALISNLKSEIH